MALHVFNTLTRKKEEFIPERPPVVRIYTCGLTVYSPMHIGHARTYCFWDVFRRWLEYRGFYVMSVINYTDIDDRNIQAATATRGAMDIAEYVGSTFRRDCRALRIKDYAVYTRATDFVSGQAEMVRQLLEKNHAYVVDGEVFYDISSFPGYGKLSGRTPDMGQVGGSGRLTEDAGRKRHPADFTLWKPSDAGTPTWQTGQAGWDSGRPGWHIECSTMSSATLGHTFDVHGGAVDNLFPHHENEIAQSEPLCGCKTWVRYWMHPEHLDLRGEKMSKSLGNVIGIPALLSNHAYDEIRWFYSMTHYRSKLSFSDELIDSAAEGFAKIKKLVRVLEDKLAGADDEQLTTPVAGTYASLRQGDQAVPRLRERFVYGKFAEITARMMEKFIKGMDDDMNAPLATAALFDYANELYAAGIEQHADVADVLAAYQALARHLYVLGIEYPNERLFPELAAECLPVGSGEEGLAPYKQFIDKLLEMRQAARKAKDFAKADMLRDVLAEAGLNVEDTPQGPRWELG
ncbi:cysteine--tRNA ligase [bacterium]|nr:cysteine--tRNA ligase [bacterium]